MLVRAALSSVACTSSTHIGSPSMLARKLTVTNLALVVSFFAFITLTHHARSDTQATFDAIPPFNETKWVINEEKWLKSPDSITWPNSAIWKNPQISVSDRGYWVNGKEADSIDGVENLLLALPKSAWPLGRIVVAATVSQVPFGAEDKMEANFTALEKFLAAHKIFNAEGRLFSVPKG